MAVCSLEVNSVFVGCSRKHCELRLGAREKVRHRFTCCFSSDELLRTSQSPSHRQHSMPPDLIVHPLARTQNFRCSVSPFTPCSELIALCHTTSRVGHSRVLYCWTSLLSFNVCLYSVCRCACAPPSPSHCVLPFSPPPCCTATVEGLEVH